MEEWKKTMENCLPPPNRDPTLHFHTFLQRGMALESGYHLLALPYMEALGKSQWLVCSLDTFIPCPFRVDAWSVDMMSGLEQPCWINRIMLRTRNGRAVSCLGAHSSGSEQLVD